MIIHVLTQRSKVRQQYNDGERSVMSHEHDPLYSRPTFQPSSSGHRLTHTLLRFYPGTDASCWAVTGRWLGWRLEDGWLIVAAAASGCFREVVTLIDRVTAASQGRSVYACETGGNKEWFVLWSPAPSPLHALTHTFSKD